MADRGDILKRIKKDELKSINGGFKISGPILTAGLSILKYVFDVGRYLGSSIRRISSKNMCSLY